MSVASINEDAVFQSDLWRLAIAGIFTKQIYANQPEMLLIIIFYSTERAEHEIQDQIIY